MKKLATAIGIIAIAAVILIAGGIENKETKDRQEWAEKTATCQERTTPDGTTFCY